MHQKTPIIVYGILHNYNTKTYAIPDLIVRNDYLHLLCDKYQLPDSELEPSEYSIVYVKNISIDVKNDQIQGNMVHKVDVYIANQALPKPQEYTYLITRKWKVSDEILKYNEYMGIIEFTDDIADKATEAIDWIRRLRLSGYDIRDLYPNMCNGNDYPWKTAKREIAIANEEITLLWNCGNEQRNLMIEHGIYRWRHVDVDLLNFKGQRRDLLKRIIDINKSTAKIWKPSLLKRADNPKILNLFVDFETVAEFNDVPEMIYMIGCGKQTNDQWQFDTLIVDKLDYICEKEMIIKWFAKLEDMSRTNLIHMYHWSYAEHTLLKKTVKRHGLEHEMTRVFSRITWIDLLKIFKDNEIVVRGAFNYSLKTIAKACYNNGLIDVKWDDNDIDGKQAMMLAYQCNIKLQRDGRKLGDYIDMQDTIRYNEVDCRVLYKLYNLIYQ
jgi:hypothetical protein